MKRITRQHARIVSQVNLWVASTHTELAELAILTHWSIHTVILLQWYALSLRQQLSLSYSQHSQIGCQPDANVRGAQTMLTSLG